ncbi:MULTISPECIES: nucleotide disphospho-sugar-binding domain-containing protein [unclassified Geodermatophilus]|uniref:nucleotide disphospho-sugar-binding domain-containing protein n=1 Tax=unclassified Geodermatophilus TaxID=2637632 RepID=UPI003EEA4912
MRVLLVAAPLTGHVLPLVPPARALRDAGHDVLFATAAEGVDVVRRAGLPAHDVAPGLSMRRAFVAPLLRHPVRIGRMVAGDEGTDGVGLLFASVSGRMAAGTVALARDWRPDLVLHEGLAAAGALAAARCGVPSVLVDALVFDGWALFRAVAGNLVRPGAGVLPEPVDAVVAIPPSLAGERRGRPMRYVPASGTGGLPADLRLPRDRPTLLVSRSTVDDPRPDRLMSRVVEAAAGADVDVVLVRPDRRATRKPLPANVTTTDWLPFGDAFPLVAGVVHHGGAGTLMTALVAGVPQIVVPGAGDRTAHARLLARRGAGLAVPLAELDAATLERLVGDASLTANAREVAAEIAAMPHPAEVVPHLEALAAR